MTRLTGGLPGPSRASVHPRPSSGPRAAGGAEPLLPDIEGVLREQGVYVSTSVGTSMRPMLRSRQDTIVIRPLAGRLRRLDVALYRTPGGYVLHRVVRVLPDSYVIIGDNCLQEEHVSDDQVVGVLSEFYRGERHVLVSSAPYRAYAHAWVATAPVRHLARRGRAWLGRRVRALCRVLGGAR